MIYNPVFVYRSVERPGKICVQAASAVAFLEPADVKHQLDVITEMYKIHEQGVRIFLAPPEFVQGTWLTTSELEQLVGVSTRQDYKPYIRQRVNW